ncbi:MAG: hypothetical protein ACOZCO_17950 [Bacteroidota bacterium]
MNRFLVILLFFFVGKISKAESYLDLISSIEKGLNITLVLDTGHADSWNVIDYKKVNDTVSLKNFLTLMQNEFGKYPENYFEKINIQYVVVGRDMRYGSQKRAAIPDPYLQTVYYEIDPSYEDYYYIHVLHHELHHCTEYAVWKNMFYPWQDWMSKNKKKFTYGKGGASTYEGDNVYIDWYSFTHPQKGFVNLYSTTGQEEDRCEMVALIMSDVEREHLIRLKKKDRIIRKKMKLILKLLDEVSGTKENYWRKTMN